MSASAFPQSSRSPFGSGAGFATPIPQAGTPLAGSPFGCSPHSMFPANLEPNPQHALVPVFSPGSHQCGNPLSYSARPFAQPVFQNQNAAPCVQQPPLQGGRFRGPPPSGAWFCRPSRPAQPPCHEPLPAPCCRPAPPLEQQKPPETKPEGVSGLKQRDRCPEKTGSSDPSSKGERPVWPQGWGGGWGWAQIPRAPESLAVSNGQALSCEDGPQSMMWVSQEMRVTTGYKLAEGKVGLERATPGRGTLGDQGQGQQGLAAVRPESLSPPGDC